MSKEQRNQKEKESCGKGFFRKKLTYKERIDWFVANFYETGMEYELIYDSFKSEDLGRIKWYDDFIKIPKYKDEL